MALEQLKAVRNELFFLSKTLSDSERQLIDALAGLSMLPPCRLLDAYRSGRQSARRSPQGAIVEFGVYRGGAMAAMAAGAAEIDSFEGVILGFDTFEGHSVAPLPDEVDLHGNPQLPIYEAKAQNHESWAACDLESVLHNYESVAQQIKKSLPNPTLIKGDACSTASQLSDRCSSGISLLRLDMDWYEPTATAFSEASKILCPNATIIVDDYGHHSGAKKATDEYLAKVNRPYDYTMTDYSCLRITFLADSLSPLLT